MSIEPACLYCDALDKFRCRTQEQANDCSTFRRKQALLAEIRGQRTEHPKEKAFPVTCKEIDSAIEILTRLRKQIGKQDV